MKELICACIYRMSKEGGWSGWYRFRLHKRCLLCKDRPGKRKEWMLIENCECDATKKEIEEFVEIKKEWKVSETTTSSSILNRHLLSNST